MDIKSLIHKLHEWLHLKNKASIEDFTDLPLPVEIFTAEQLERYAITLALSHKPAEKPTKDIILLRQLTNSETTLTNSYNFLIKASENKESCFSPGREWLLDNFYVIQEQIYNIRANLPKSYGRTLPQIVGGRPRIYDIAFQKIEHSDGRWDLQNLSRFISAYQEITPLTLGELWATPIALGIALIENLSNASKRVVADIKDYNLANLWADKMIDVAMSDPKKLVMIIADMARSDPAMTPGFIAELSRRLQAATLTLPLNWLEQHLAEEGLSIEQLVQQENKQQAATQLTISNSIAGLRYITEVNWRDFVEKMSLVENILRLDPTGTYGKMDFGTRDNYRHVVERLSRASLHSEKEVATRAVRLANEQEENLRATNAHPTPTNTRHCHVGFYLIAEGLPLLMKELDLCHTFWQKICLYSKKWALQLYFGSILLITGVLVYVLLNKAIQSNIDTLWLSILGISIAVVGSQLAVALVNLGATLVVKPKPLPKMDFSKGIPSSFRSLVVVPAMLGSVSEIKSLIEALEIRFLGNRDNHLHFALLTDFNDAPKEHMPEDAELLNLAATKINELNKRYSSKEFDFFYLFHRPRQWNETEQVWMGKERKRGKLADLNNLLRENNKTAFSLIIGHIGSLPHIKYVITLDSDTELARESAHQFVGTMVHPLNRPILDTEKNIVVEGYGILQPRVAEALPNTTITRYVWLYGNEFGIDPYTRTISDVYQDVFDEGSFIGKGIYDVDIFQHVLANRFPENRILSHDLLEGCYLRSGFLSDVALYEKSPSSYLADAKRRTRWIRGDWQLIRWLLPFISTGNGHYESNPLSCLSKFKIVDNLRRSLVPIFLLLLLALNWTILPDICFWLGVILGILVLPLLVNTLVELIRKPIGMLFGQYVTTIMRGVQRSTLQLIFYLCCLPHEAWYSLSAIFRTGWRMMISKQHLLEWTPSDQINQRLRGTMAEWLVNLWIGPALALIATSFLLIHKRFECLLFASPLLTLWFLSPIITAWLSQPLKDRKPKLDPAQIRFLHTMARKTWDFFDRYLTPENHWLPPDNYQETPIEALARRTSPTNMGLLLLANLSAYDFGYLTLGELLERTSNTLNTMIKLERYRGHLYNWYSTETLAPLLPRYVSTVDSGNLAGHLLTLRQGLLSLLDTPLLNTRYIEGIKDTFEILHSELQSFELNNFKEILGHAKKSFSNWAEAILCCEKLCTAAEKINNEMNEMKDKSEWSKKLLLQCHSLQKELKLFDSIPGLTKNTTLRDLILLTSTHSISHIDLIEELSEKALSLTDMDMDFLIDKANNLMTIGFNVEIQRRDPSNYDLLSSEARLGNFVAISKGQIEQKSWFALGRLMVSNGPDPILISWNGSMFEYLMPLLVMPTYKGTLLDHTYRSVVKRQIEYGKQRGVPWGVSESGFNAVDNQYNYLYRAFGVPGLGLKRGLEEDLVITPYATALALMIEPEAACLNLQRMSSNNAIGQFGFYESIDFTSARLPRDDSKYAIVRSFMAHHQGMILLAFSYLLHNQPMQKRFRAEPLFKASLLLLQERMPKPMASYLKLPKIPKTSITSKRPESSLRVFHNPNTRTPQVQLLSNGSYHLMITQAGGGYSQWKHFALTRWRADSTCDNWGTFIYIRDLSTGDFCSTNYQPTTGSVDNFKAIFSESHAEFTRKDMLLDMHTEVVVSPEDNMELRRVRIHNRAKIRRTIEFTSYAEIVLAPFASDLAQPAFSNLFIETEIIPPHQCILAMRRPQNEQENYPWLCHLLNVYSDHHYVLSFETDRTRFIGRGFTLAKPRVLTEQEDLSNTQGAVLDPIVAIRCRLTLEADDLVVFDLLTGVSENRKTCLELVEKYRDHRLANRIFELAWTHGQVLLHQLNISEAEAQLFSKIASAILYPSNTYRADSHTLMNNRNNQSSLWGFSISGDLPIVLLFIEDPENIDLVRQLIQAHTYWRRKGLMVDLIILNNEPGGYRQSLQEQIVNLITSNTSMITEHGGNIITRSAEQLPPENVVLLQSVARIILSDRRGTLKEQLSRHRLTPPMMPILNVKKPPPRTFFNNELASLPKNLQYFNGIGGFTKAGDEYIIRLTEKKSTPMPWANVLANSNFGTVVSEKGQGYTWSENAHEFRLTPWDNDPLLDSSGEAFYLRDDETGFVWSPTALPSRGEGDYQARHGFGYSVFEHNEDGIYTELWMSVDLDDPVKFFILKIHNKSLSHRYLSATGFVSWVLGDLPTKNVMHVVTETTEDGAILAQNHYNSDFGERVAFFDAATINLDLSARSITGDRTEFLGRNGSLQNPAALKRNRLSGRVGAGLDPCAAIQLNFYLAKDQTREIVFTLGSGKNRHEAISLSKRNRALDRAKASLASVREYWRNILNKVAVETPDPAINFLANGWLLYQLLSSRLWGRSGYYQSGGAFGFRDQLQDVMALSQIAPILYRDQLLLCAAHQFEEGDVQHWWHPPQNRGVRTRCSDDYLWLPFALCHYIETTGDIKVLDETIPFLQGRLLKEGEESYYELPIIGKEAVSLYQHAVRAIQYGLKFGEHGLPLMGSGDWNDGMDKVGIEGRGESVWLGFFLYTVLKRFANLADRYGDNRFAEQCKTESSKVQQHIEQQGWDGQWYRRAYFDDGTPLGSNQNSECRIDSISQSWAVLSGAADPARAKSAMDAVYHYLVNTEDGLIKLLDPPFDKSKPNPGYIAGYVPGVRENGGQYTHAAIWAAMAFAELNEKDKFLTLFQILNPIYRCNTPEEMNRYKIEPYVVAADIYSVTPHTGRGGWSWYTGSAGWLYRLITETLLGIRLEEGQRLYLKPMLPDNWESMSVNYTFKKTLYKITMSRSSDKKGIFLDGTFLENGPITLVDDEKQHHITMEI